MASHGIGSRRTLVSMASQKLPETLFRSGSDRARYVRGMFGQIARRYDLMNTLMTVGRHQAWRKLVARSLVRSEDRVLDVGCGTGDLALACAEAGADVVVGIDFAEPMLAHARCKARNRGVEGLSFALADATRLPVDNCSVDVWCAGFVVRNIPDLDVALAEAHRVLRPGGRIAVLETPRLEQGLLRPLIRMHLGRLVPLVGRMVTGHGSAYEYLPVSVDQFLTPREFSQALRNAGFRVTSVRRFMLGAVVSHIAVKLDDDMASRY